MVSCMGKVKFSTQTEIFTEVALFTIKDMVKGDMKPQKGESGKGALKRMFGMARE